MNIGNTLATSAKLLHSVSDAPYKEAERLLAEILKVTSTYLHTWPEKHIAKVEELQLQTLLTKRLAGAPLAYVLGVQAFWDMEFYVNEHTLIPRSETEVLIEIILAKFGNLNTLKIIDLGTGSGVLALTLAKAKPQWQIYATDISLEALRVAEKNAARYQIKNVQFYLSDWFTDLSIADFDVIVSNPPYIAASDPFLEKNVLLTEPRQALIAGETGLEAITQIIANAPKYLVNTGCLLLEHGFLQGNVVRQLLSQSGFNQIEIIYDLAGKERAAFAKINYF